MSVRFGFPKNLVRTLLLGVLTILPALRAQELSPVDTSTWEGYETTFPAMGSTMSIIVYADSEEKATKAFEEVRLEVARLNDIMSDYEPDSELNQSLLKAFNPTPLSIDLWNVLLASEQWSQQTHGAFDASVGTLTRLWRSARRTRNAPSKKAIEEAKSRSGWQHVSLDASSRSLKIDVTELKIDLGGIAAGYIIDAAFDVMDRNGLDHCLINAGGDIRCGASPPGRQGWRIEVAPIAPRKSALSKPAQKGTLDNGMQNRELDSQPLRRIYLSNAAIVTSGDLWQYSEFDGVRRSHIIDPKTGIGVPGPSVVAVISTKCVDADAAATAISVMGIEKGMIFASNHTYLAALMVNRKPNSETLDYRVTENFPQGIFDPKSKSED